MKKTTHGYFLNGMHIEVHIVDDWICSSCHEKKTCFSQIDRNTVFGVCLDCLKKTFENHHKPIEL